MEFFLLYCSKRIEIKVASINILENIYYVISYRWKEETTKPQYILKFKWQS